MSLPDFFATMLAEQYDAETVERILEGCRTERCASLRANTLLASREDVAGALDGAGMPWAGVSWYPDAFVLDRQDEPRIRELALYEQGRLYLQSLSSMIPPLALDARAGEDVLDMCAAPGGKTTQIAALTGGRAHITACEMHAPRAEKLEYNLRKLGAANITIMRTDARRLDDFFRFDRILVDAPCSGSGTVRDGDPRVAKRFTPKLVEKSMKSQKALLAKALRIVKPGGTVVYSTCSVLACENEDIVTECLKQARKVGTFELQPLNLDRSALPCLPTKLDEALCLAPTDLYEGFFVAKIKRS